jgi:hypothetical protein
MANNTAEQEAESSEQQGSVVVRLVIEAVTAVIPKSMLTLIQKQVTAANGIHDSKNPTSEPKPTCYLLSPPA